jgi:hypothetical protein
MKKLSSCAALIALLAAPLAAERATTLDTALTASAKGISSTLAEGTKTVVVEIKSDGKEASDYLANELTLKLFQTGKLVMVDRQNIDAIRAELSFQTSGEVSDESGQRLGAMLGAETLITGSFERLNGDYRLTIKALKVETAEIQYLSSMTVAADSSTEALFGRDTAGVAAAKKVGSSAASAVKNVAGFSGRFICSAINPIVGIGSFMQGDVRGGSRVAFWEVVGSGALVYGRYRANNDLSNGSLLAGTGGFVLGAAVVYAIVRPWMYNRAPEVTEVLDKVTIGCSAHRDRDERIVSVGYVYRY